MQRHNDNDAATPTMGIAASSTDQLGELAQRYSARSRRMAAFGLAPTMVFTGLPPT